MKTILPFVVALLSAACTALPHAPIIYSSRTTVGVNVETAPTSTEGPIINVGFTVDDFGWVPIAGCTLVDQKDPGKGCKDMEKFRSAYRRPDGNLNEDAFSLFGRFESRGLIGNAGAAPARATSLTAGKVFASGVAADNLTAAQLPEMQSGCIERITKSDAPSSKDLLKQQLAICGVELK